MGGWCAVARALQLDTTVREAPPPGGWARPGQGWVGSGRGPKGDSEGRKGESRRERRRGRDERLEPKLATSFLEWRVLTVSQRMRLGLIRTTHQTYTSCVLDRQVSTQPLSYAAGGSPPSFLPFLSLPHT